MLIDIKSFIIIGIVVIERFRRIVIVFFFILIFKVYIKGFVEKIV